MPLRDSFHGSLRRELDWQSFCTGWATVLTVRLNQILPEGFRAAPSVQYGTEVSSQPGPGEWQPSEPVATLSFELQGGTAEVLVHAYRDGRYLAGAIELVSGGNKDRAEAREAFVAKCETYVQR